MQTYANFRFNSCINLAEKAYKSVNARFCAHHLKILFVLLTHAMKNDPL